MRHWVALSGHRPCRVHSAGARARSPNDDGRPQLGGDEPDTSTVCGRDDWRYLLRLRDVSGTGLHLTSLVRSFAGVDFHHALPQSTAIDIRIDPYGLIEIPCWESLYRGSFGAHRTASDLQVRKTFSGQDGSGRDVRFTADLFFDLHEPPERPRLLEFAKFTDREFSSIPQPHYCETVPSGIRVVDRTKAQRIHFLVGTDNVYILGGTPFRTRWISPSGQEIKVIDSKVLTLGLHKSGIFLYESATHSIPRELFSERPGVWKLELFVNGQYEGVYTIQVV
jgi:hypothetical protein